MDQSHRSDERNAVARLGVEDSHPDLRGVFVAAETGYGMLRGKERRWKRGLGGNREGGETPFGFRGEKLKELSNLHLGGFNHLEKYESMGRTIPYIIEKTCLKPPTRTCQYVGFP